MLIALKQSLGLGLIVGGLGQYLFPEFTGVFGAAIKVSIEHRELIGTISFIGGLIIFYMPTDNCK